MTDMPAPLAARLEHLVRRLHHASVAIGTAVHVDPAALVSLRSGPMSSWSTGRSSVTGGSRLLPCTDDWIAMTLSRDDDLALVSPLVERTVAPEHDAVWAAVGDWCASRDVATVVERAVLLGLACAAVDEPQDPARDDDGLIVTSIDDSVPPTASLEGIRVVELSALWAGPLCGALLAEAGADVVKVDSRREPDPSSPFAALDAHKRRHRIDVATSAGRTELHRLLSDADVVIEASRPRALAQLGVDVPLAGPRVWLSITAHGYGGGSGNRIGYGDDTAAAGGLVERRPDGPAFTGDAVADPLTGLTATVVALERLAAGGRHHVDIAMSAVAYRAATASASA